MGIDAPPFETILGGPVISEFSRHTFLDNKRVGVYALAPGHVLRVTHLETKEYQVVHVPAVPEHLRALM